MSSHPGTGTLFSRSPCHLSSIDPASSNQKCPIHAIKVRKSCQNRSTTISTAQRRSNVNSVTTPTKRSQCDSFGHNMYVIYVLNTITLYDKVASARIEHTPKLYGRLYHYFSGDQKSRSKYILDESCLNPKLN